MDAGAGKECRGPELPSTGSMRVQRENLRRKGCVVKQPYS